MGGGRGAKPLECEGQVECESVGVGLASDEGEGEAGAEAGIVSAELRSVGEWVVVLRDGEQERSGRVERIVMQRDGWWMCGERCRAVCAVEAMTKLAQHGATSSRLRCISRLVDVAPAPRARLIPQPPSPPIDHKNGRRQRPPEALRPGECAARRRDRLLCQSVSGAHARHLTSR